jgi:hypothetical protein
VSAVLIACEAPPARAAEAPVGIALAVVFDTSGSMRQPIATTAGRKEPKQKVAQRAFLKVITRLDAFARQPGSPPLSVAVYVFEGQEAVVARRLAPFDAAALRKWVTGLGDPAAATPLGDALLLAGNDLLAVDALSRHVLVLTDGANTAGRDPVSAITELNRSAARRKLPVQTHIIALDLNPKVFEPLQKNGALLIGASDEAQLNARFDYILEEKILVEAPR